eukprot:scaffold2941_cov102-Isochrysis_galbana.AAC.6
MPCGAGVSVGGLGRAQEGRQDNLVPPMYPPISIFRCPDACAAAAVLILHLPPPPALRPRRQEKKSLEERATH